MRHKVRQIIIRSYSNHCIYLDSEMIVKI